MKYKGWAVYQGNIRVTDKHMTEYEAENKKIQLSSILSNLEIREVTE
jgi:hypothetical protein